MTKQRFLILHNIRSAQNVGSLFRTADAAGIDIIYLSSITPAPIDRFGRMNASVVKASLGAEESVNWKQYDDIKNLITTLKQKEVTIVAIEQSKRAVDYKTITANAPIAFILGNEISGLPEDILAMVDVVAEIAMRGDKESLNVSVAGGIALFRILNI